MSASRSPSRDRLLTLLRGAGEGPVSGTRLAAALGISRPGVWKAVRALQAAGYPIEALPGRGYRLLGEPDPLTVQAIAPHLSSPLFPPHHLHCLAVTDSTNLRAAALARAGAPQGTVVVADRQTGGRGRLGRAWFSPPGVNLYFSLVLRPLMEPRHAAQLTLVAGLALAEAVAGLPVPGLTIKWPNDLLHRGTKVAGILTEMGAEPDRVVFVVVGVGINVNLPAALLPPELRGVAGSLREAAGRSWRRAEILARFLLNFETWYGRYLAGGFGAIRPAWLAHAALLGERVRVNLLTGSYSGVARDLDAEGFLLVERDDGVVERVTAGDVSAAGE